MKDMFDALEKVLPFLEQYPDWVRGLVALWVVFAAVLLALLLLVPRTAPDTSAELSRDPTLTRNQRSATRESTMEGVWVPTGYTKPPEALELANVLDTLKGDKLTKLQIAQFVRRNTGTIVEWKVEVVDVTTGFRSDPNGELYLAFSPLGDERQILREVMIAVFSQDAESGLSTLAAGDIVYVRGKLKFSEGGAGWTVLLEAATLISVSRPKG